MSVLKNKTILITKADYEAEKALVRLVREGAEIIYFPTIKVVPIIENSRLKEIMDSIEHVDFLVFTSGNAVDIFGEMVFSKGFDFTHTKIAAVGKSTADRCRANGFYVHIMPEDFSAEGLINCFANLDVANKNILIPTSALAREDLTIGLTALGAEVHPVSIYDVIENELDELQTQCQRIAEKFPDLFVFTSPSSFNNYVSLMEVDDVVSYFGNSLICSIGSTTEAELRSHGLTVHIVPSEFSLHGVSEAILKYFYSTTDLV